MSAVAALSLCGHAAAQPTSHPDAQQDYQGDERLSETSFRRPHGQMEFGLNLLTLPDAEVCVEGNTGCRKGDVSLAVNGWPLFRAAERWAVGAGLSMTVTTSGAPPLDDPQGIGRVHSRDYFTVEGTGRYYPLLGDRFETWVGVVSGLVVVRDGFTVQFDAPENVYIGPESVTIATEGLSLSAAVGGAFLFTRDLSLGAQLRAGSWFLPNEPAYSNLGDTASLAGSTVMLDLGVMLTYRVRE